VNKYDVGQVLPSLEPADIGEAVNNMLADPAELARKHGNALEASRKEFYWEKESSRLTHLYQGIFQDLLGEIRPDGPRLPAASASKSNASL
jgi:hypothetical protein